MIREERERVSEEGHYQTKGEIDKANEGLLEALTLKAGHQPNMTQLGA